MPILLASASLFVVAFTLALVLSIAVHSFVQAGTLGIYFEAERAAAAGSRTPAFARFTVERFLALGRRGWWTIFLLYNVIWGVFGAVLLVPVVAIAVPMLIWNETPAVIIAGCVGLGLLLIVMVFLGILIDAWVKIVLVACVGSVSGVRESIRLANRLIRRRIGELITVIAVRIAIAVVVESGFTVVYFGFGAGSILPALEMFLLPFQIAVSLAHSIISLAASAWLLAALVGVASLEEAAQRHATA